MLIAIVRHGAVGLPPFLVEPSLLPLGEGQMREVARALRRWDWEAVVSSPLLRARQSADIVCRDLRLPLIVDESLRERFHGPLEGRVIAPCAARVDLFTKLPGREGIGGFIRRVIQGFENLASSHSGRGIIAITHGGVIKVFHTAVLRERIDRIKHAEPLLVELTVAASGGLVATKLPDSVSTEGLNGDS